MANPEDLPDHFRRVVVALFKSKQLRTLGEPERAVAAMNIAKHNGLGGGTVTKASTRRDMGEVKQTIKGFNKGRKKVSDGSHRLKMREFDRIWELYLEKMQDESPSER